MSKVLTTALMHVVHDVEAVLSSKADPGTVVRAKISLLLLEDGICCAKFVPNI